MFKRYITAAFLAIAAVTSLSAQNFDAFKDQLATSNNGASVRVVEHGDAHAALVAADNQITQSTIRGYRVGIFYDNSQDARTRANNAETSFKNSFDGIPLYKDYRNPYFIVAVGNCLSQEEVTILWGRVKNIFPNAYIMRADIPIAELMETD